MVELYATLIINKRRTINTVPSGLRGAVIEALLTRGYDENGDKIMEV
ncbi:MAG: CD1375 family protein [Anaerorhabdus sp.]